MKSNPLTQLDLKPALAQEEESVLVEEVTQRCFHSRLVFDNVADKCRLIFSL